MTKLAMYGIGFLFAGGAVTAAIAGIRRDATKDYALKQTQDSLRLAETERQTALSERDTALARKQRERIVYADRILSGTSPTIPRPQVEELARLCRESETSCAAQRKAAQELIDNLRGQVTNLSQQKERKPPRFSAYAEAQYDWLNSEPLGRVGAAFRIVGPFSVTVGLEGAPNRNGVSQNRGTAGLRFEFR